MPQTRVTATTRLKTMECRVCHKPMQVGSNTRNEPRCLSCGIQAGTDAMVQMQRKSGPYYERWLNGMRSFNETLGGGGGGG